ncbi:MAG: cell division protein FtsZ, partial [Alphaproteobacteria bacterium]|nr:cell division protein FtsZ [Alphaproteobacteria bacterium]
MSIKLQLPELTDLRPRLVVIGVGGAGCNAVNNMIAAGLTGVEFVVANTDAQALAASSAEHRLQLGANLTEGLGAGSKPEIGQAAAEEAIEEIRGQISGAHMVFVAAGMGGGTGTGAAAIIASVAKELGILTVGVVTKPFQFEGARRMRIAEAGIAELKKTVDTLIVIPNQNLFRLANEKTTFSEAFILADQVLYSGVACIVDLIIKEGLINLDFADVRTVISGMGAAMMGTGEASGERRAVVAAEEAIANPLLDDVSLQGARGLLLSITGSSDLTLYEVDEAASRVREEVDPEANIIVGATFDDSLGDRVRVSIVASGMHRGLGESNQPVWSNATPTPIPAPESTATPAGYAPQAADQGRGASMHERLSEALQQGAETASDGQHHGDMPASPFAAQSRADSAGPPPLDATGSWVAPGQVTIEDGLPPLPHTSSSQPYDGYGAQNFSEPQDFQPVVAEQIPRAGRRMPSVEDFPPHAQMEYHHKQAHHQVASEQEAGEQSDVQPRKRTLLDRLRGRARRKSDSVVENSNSELNSQSESDLSPNDSRFSTTEQAFDTSDTEPVNRQQSA